MTFAIFHSCSRFMCVSAFVCVCSWPQKTHSIKNYPGISCCCCCVYILYILLPLTVENEPCELLRLLPTMVIVCKPPPPSLSFALLLSLSLSLYCCRYCAACLTGVPCVPVCVWHVSATCNWLSTLVSHLYFHLHAFSSFLQVFPIFHLSGRCLLKSLIVLDHICLAAIPSL